VQDKKNNVRKYVYSLLQSLDDKTIQQQSQKACSRIINSSIYTNCNLVLSYMAMEKELDTMMIILDCIKQGKTVALPKTIDKTNDMDFYLVDPFIPLESQLIKGRWNIREPNPEVCKKLDPLLLDSKSLMIVPGVAFSSTGQRLGHGKGFYDKYLDKYNNSIKVGICLSCQLLETIPVDQNDKNMDYVITPDYFFESTDNIINCGVDEK